MSDPTPLEHGGEPGAPATLGGRSLREQLRRDAVVLPTGLLRRSGWRAWGWLARAHLLVASVVAVGAALHDRPLLALLAAFVPALLAQRSLQTLVHHLSHDLLTRRRNLNDLLGNLLVAGFIGMRIENYRRVHFVHHVENGSASDPEFIDFDEVDSRGGLARYVGHFVLGGEALALVRKYYGPARAAPRHGAAAAPPRSLARRALELGTVASAQAALLAAFWWVGAPQLYLVWLYVALTWSPMLSRLRFLVEHPGKDERTVSTRAAWWESALFAPFQFNYHFEHHVWPGLPPYNLGRAHRHIAATGFFERHPEYVADDFLGALRRRAASR